MPLFVLASTRPNSIPSERVQYDFSGQCWYKGAQMSQLDPNRSTGTSNVTHSNKYISSVRHSMIVCHPELSQGRHTNIPPEAENMHIDKFQHVVKYISTIETSRMSTNRTLSQLSNIQSMHAVGTATKTQPCANLMKFLLKYRFPHLLILVG